MSDNFSIEIKNQRWITERSDNLYDVCSHGDVIVKIGNEILSDTELALNTSTLYLLRTLTQNHVADFGNPTKDFSLLPCCGNTLIAEDNSENVYVITCPYGADFSVEHKNGQVKLTTENGANVIIPFEEYKKVAHDFADKVEAFYDSQPPRLFNHDYEQQGYEKFWNEWKRRRAV